MAYITISDLFTYSIVLIGFATLIVTIMKRR